MGAKENSIRSKVTAIRNKVKDALSSITDAETGWRAQVEEKLRAAATALEEAADAIVETPPEGESTAQKTPEAASTAQPDSAAVVTAQPEKAAKPATPKSAS